jgi:hypothetical protein
MKDLLPELESQLDLHAGFVRLTYHTSIGYIAIGCTLMSPI